MSGASLLQRLLAPAARRRYVIDGVETPVPTLAELRGMLSDPAALRVGVVRRALIAAEMDAAEMDAVIGGTLGASGRLYPDGSRGCFHDGCDAADGGEGGTHWCRWAT